MRQWSFISFVAACTVTALAKPSWPKVDTGALAQRNSLLERGDQALADSPIEERSVLTNIYDVKMDMYGMCAETGGVIVTTIKTELHVFIQSKIADAVAVNATPMTNLTVFERHPDYVTVQLTVKGDYNTELDDEWNLYYDCCRAVLIVRFDAHYSEDTIENLTASLENYCAPDPRAEKPKCDDPRGWPGHTACNILSSTLTVDGNRYTPTVVPAAP